MASEPDAPDSTKSWKHAVHTRATEARTRMQLAADRNIGSVPSVHGSHHHASIAAMAKRERAAVASTVLEIPRHLVDDTSPPARGNEQERITVMRSPGL